ncbi:MAG: PLP-dependent aminotransferase family protein [Rhodospirillales bacterium]|nr:PLP-dependent aminotransferase family protein [Rhodospirillales bacterium]
MQGSQQGLDFAAKILVDPEDVIITEDPTFLGALIAFNPYQPKYSPEPMDQDGMQMQALEHSLKDTATRQNDYTVPNFQNPTGVTLSLSRRQELIEIANDYDVIVLEDTPYRHIRFSGDPLPTLKSIDTQWRIIHLGSFFKILVPGLRVGWAVADPDLLEQMGLLKVAADTQTSTQDMAAASLFLERCDLDTHIAGLRLAYRRKEDVMLTAIR